MESLESAGLTLERTGVGTNRELHTIRLNTFYVASVCYSKLKNRYRVEITWIWSDIKAPRGLTRSQLRKTREYLQIEVGKMHLRSLGGQK
jgi:hypothetical protein